MTMGEVDHLRPPRQEMAETGPEAMDKAPTRSSNSPWVITPSNQPSSQSAEGKLSDSASATAGRRFTTCASLAPTTSSSPTMTLCPFRRLSTVPRPPNLTGPHRAAAAPSTSAATSTRPPWSARSSSSRATSLLMEAAKAHEEQSEDGADYDLRLITAREITHTKSRTIGNYWLLGINPEGVFVINRVDAERLGLDDGDEVKVVSATNPDGEWDLKNGH